MNQLFNRRQSQLASKLPAGFCPIMSTPGGNCLYSSVSIALFGSEAHSVELRLSAIHHAVYHYDHYVEMVCILMTVLCHIHLELVVKSLSLHVVHHTATR